MLKEFKAFAMRGNVVDLAVGVIIGAAFGKIVSSLVSDLLMPPLGVIVGGMDFSDLALTLKKADGATPAVTLNYGLFINQVLNFLIVAFAIFMLVKGLHAVKSRDPQPAAAPTEKNCPECCMVIPIQAKRCGHCTTTIR
jgi:large conductance mechanosensitive channel